MIVFVAVVVRAGEELEVAIAELFDGDGDIAVGDLEGIAKGVF